MGSQMLPYFSFVSDNNLLQKGMWHFLHDLPAMQHLTILWSLLSLPAVIWIMFSSHAQTHEENLRLSLCGHRLVKIRILKHWNCCSVYLFPALRELRSEYVSTPSRHEASCQIDYILKVPCVSSKRKMTLWMAQKDLTSANISKKSKVS